jgi:hypothetical protein
MKMEWDIDTTSVAGNMAGPLDGIAAPHYRGAAVKMDSSGRKAPIYPTQNSSWTAEARCDRTRCTGPITGDQSEMKPNAPTLLSSVSDPLSSLI